MTNSTIRTIRLFSSTIAMLIVCSISQAQNYQLDTSFESAFKFREFNSWPWENKTGVIYNVILAEDSSLRVFGRFTNPYVSGSAGDVIKVLEDGTYSSDFEFYGGNANGLQAKQFDGAAYIYHSYHFGIIDIETGVINQTFMDNKNLSDWGGTFSDVGIHSDGSFFIGSGPVYHGGLPDGRYTRIAKIHANGFYDTSFHHDANLAVKTILKYDANRFIIAGKFSEYDSVPTPFMARIFNDGTLDTSFHSIFISEPDPLYIQDDGKILVGGSFKINRSDFYLALVRINADGSLDHTFNNFNNLQTPNGLWTTYGSTPIHYESRTICITEHNKLLIGGGFVNYQGYTRNRIALADINGFLDTLAFTGTAIDECNSCYFTFVHDIVPCGNDRYYITGRFSGFDGHEVEPIIRIRIPDTSSECIKVPEVTLYPNPAYNTIEVKLPVNSLYIKVVDLNSKILFSSEVNNANLNLVINCSGWESGIYYCSVKLSNGQFANRSFVIAK